MSDCRSDVSFPERVREEHCCRRENEERELTPIAVRLWKAEGGDCEKREPEQELYLCQAQGPPLKDCHGSGSTGIRRGAFRAYD